MHLANDSIYSETILGLTLLYTSEKSPLILQSCAGCGFAGSYKLSGYDSINSPMYWRGSSGLSFVSLSRASISDGMICLSRYWRIGRSWVEVSSSGSSSSSLSLSLLSCVQDDNLNINIETILFILLRPKYDNYATHIHIRPSNPVFHLQLQSIRTYADCNKYRSLFEIWVLVVVNFMRVCYSYD